MKNQNVQQKVFPPITEEALYGTARKAAYHVVRYLFIKTSTDYTEKLLDGFAELPQSKCRRCGKIKDRADCSFPCPNCIDKELRDVVGNNTIDIVQIAAAELWERRTDPEAFVKTCKAVRRYLYNQDKQPQKTNNTPLYDALLEIRKLLKGQKIKADPERLAYLAQVMADKKITAENIECFIAEEKSRSTKVYISTIEYLSDYEESRGEIASPDDEITKLIEAMSKSRDSKEVITEIENALQSANQKQVLEYLVTGHSNKAIAEKMGISTGRVSQQIKRVRQIVKNALPEQSRRYKL
jgi:hypothetical protein